MEKRVCETEICFCSVNHRGLKIVMRMGGKGKGEGKRNVTLIMVIAHIPRASSEHLL